MASVVPPDFTKLYQELLLRASQAVFAFPSGNK